MNMDKHTILFGCGHIAEAYVVGNTYEQDRRIAYLKICGRCPECTEKRRVNRPAVTTAAH